MCSFDSFVEHWESREEAGSKGNKGAAALHSEHSVPCSMAVWHDHADWRERHRDGQRDTERQTMWIEVVWRGLRKTSPESARKFCRGSEATQESWRSNCQAAITALSWKVREMFECLSRVRSWKLPLLIWFHRFEPFKHQGHRLKYIWLFMYMYIYIHIRLWIEQRTHVCISIYAYLHNMHRSVKW